MAAGKLPGSGYEAELPLDLGDRLPWLESDDEAERDAGTGRVIAVVAIMILMVVLSGAMFWYVRHRQEQAAMAIAGGVIKAPPGPYKVRPSDPGGSRAAGTGDTAFRNAQGEAWITGEDDVPVDLATPAAAAAGAHGVGVQIGAFATSDGAERAWPTLTARTPVLSGLGHRVVEMPGDLGGTVFGLQAVTATATGANALCAQLRAAGAKCEVKR
jgi:hypothetical protein